MLFRSEGRHDEADIGLGLAPGRTDHKGDGVLVIATAQPGAIESRAKSLGDREREISLPGAVLDIIVMKVYGAVVLRGVAPGHFLPGPGRPGHGAGRQIDQAAVQAMGSPIDHPGRGHLARKVPVGDASRLVVVDQGPIMDSRALDLAVEVGARAWSGRGGEKQRSGEAARRPGQSGFDACRLPSQRAGRSRTVGMFVGIIGEARPVIPLACEKLISIVFVVIALAWIFRSFLLVKILPGIDDAIIAIIGAVVLFVLPANSEKEKRILKWEDCKAIPWGIILLFGGGLAIADGFKSSGLAVWIGNQTSLLEGVSLIFVLITIVAVVNFLTEMTSNVATTAMFIFANPNHQHSIRRVYQFACVFR